MAKLYRHFIFSLFLLLAGTPLLAQEMGVLFGKITDKEHKEPIIGAQVRIIGTYYGTVTNLEGLYEIKDIKPGTYTISVKYMGFAESLTNGFPITAGNQTFNVEMVSKTVEMSVVVKGEPGDYNIQDPNSKYRLNQEDIKQLPVVNVKELVTLNPGVVQSPDGIQIRGGRNYEAQYMVDGASAQDPLAGTGFGIEIGSNAIDNLSVTTGGVDAEYGDGSSGLIAATIKEGGDKLQTTGMWQRDHWNGDTRGKNGWNTDIFNFAIGTPLPFTKKKVQLFTSLQANLSDLYFGPVAQQLHSSLLSDAERWAPREDNSWSHTFKLSYRVNDRVKITGTNVHSLNINQNTRALQVVGNDRIMTPGFQYPFSLNLDNASTYTHQSNLTVFNLIYNLSKSWTLNATASRLFTNLRADANGRPFRDSTIDRIYDPYSIVKDPVTLYNPEDSVVFVNPGPGLINNGGISEIWHDHYVQEYTGKVKLSYIPKNPAHFYTFGLEHKEQEYQWIDVYKPWIGAPVKINDTLTTISTSVGRSSDIWKVRPANGGLFFQDNITYKGISAILGARFNYWAPGSFADDAVANPNAPVLASVRSDYLRKTVPIGTRRYKARILPKLRVSFPVTNNNVLYFNYGHNMKLAHPRFVYAGLDPVYQDNSFLSNLGNPDIDPEVTVSYELGIKSQVTRNFAFTFTAFYNDKFDYIVSRTAVVKDRTGRFVEKTFYINQDYARIRGVETSLTRKFGRSMKIILNGSYQIATGKSNSALESRQQIRQNGAVSTSKENYLAWDRPVDLKMIFIFRPDTTFLKFSKKADSFKLRGPVKLLRNVRLSFTTNFKSGMRYTPYSLTGNSPTGRPMYERIESKPFSKIATPWFWTDVRLSKDLVFGKGGKRNVSLSVEVRNLFNNKNAQIINPVTGRAYEPGDPVPFEWRDPAYPHPQDSGVPPTDPSRYLAPRQVLFGLSYAL